MERPTSANGKVCYLEIPASDPEKSAMFYRVCFGWNIRKNNEGHLSFDDTIGEVSGMWVKGRKPLAEAGIIISIMVDNIESAIDLVQKNGGKIVRPLGMDAPELTAWFTDPFGNILGLYEEPRYLTA